MDNLDAQDKAICEAIIAGKPNEEIMADFEGVSEDKINSLRTHVEQNGGANEVQVEQGQQDNTKTEDVDTSKSEGGEAKTSEAEGSESGAGSENQG